MAHLSGWPIGSALSCRNIGNVKPILAPCSYLAQKKAGKTLLNSLLTCYRWLTRPGVHFALGNDFDQGAMLQGDMIGEMVKRHPILKRYVKINKGELIFQPTNSRLITLPADYAGSSGHNFLSVSFTEIWAFTWESHLRLYEELTPPPLVGALRIVDSYAGWQGESILLENIWNRGKEGEQLADDLYLTGQQLSFIAEGEAGHKATWRGNEQQRQAYLTEQRDTLREATYRRLHFNEWQASEDVFIPIEAWQDCIIPGFHPLEAGSQRPVYLGLDLATSANGDNAALCGTYLGDDNKVCLALHKVWKSSERQTKLRLKGTVFPYILGLRDRFNIIACYYDPYQAIALTEDLQAAGVRCVEVPQTHASRGPRDTRLMDLINSRKLVLYDDPDIHNLASQARAKELPNGQIFLKKASGRSKIDLLIAMSNCVSAVRQSIYHWAR